MPVVVNIDGNILPAERARVSVLDRGFLYGDSVYEVVRTYQGRSFALAEHLDRLQRSADRLDIHLPDRDWLEQQVLKTLEAGGHRESYCRIIVTRGSGPITLDPTTAQGCLCVMLVQAYQVFPDWMYTQGVKVAIPSIRRNPPSALDPAIKSGNYLNSVMALGEARKAGFDDALMLDVEGRVTEATSANVFALLNGRLCTPALEAGLLAGVTRAFVIRLASELGIRCEECALYPGDLKAAEEVMLTSTLKEVMPVVQVGEGKVGSGAPGPVAGKLREALQAFALLRVGGQGR